MFLSSCVKMCQSLEKPKDVEVVENESKVATRLAEIMAAAANKVLQDKEFFTVGLSGGSLVNFLIEGLPGVDAQFEKWKFFFCDERLVPTDDMESTFGLFKRKVIGKIPIQESQFVTVDTSLTPREAAADYENKIRHHIGDTIVPVFDCLLLGMGPDGHTCSLFPGHPLLEVTNQIVASIEDSPKPPPARVTLTFPVLNAASLCIFAIAGASKAEMVKRVLRDEEDLPSTRVRPTNGRLVWLLDTKAASLLQIES